jgi:hypothetical protein
MEKLTILRWPTSAKKTVIRAVTIRARSVVGEVLVDEFKGTSIGPTVVLEVGVGAVLQSADVTGWTDVLFPSAKVDSGLAAVLELAA